MEVKQVIVMRTKYPDGKGGYKGLRKGKEIAQGSHSSGDWMRTELLAAYREQRPPNLTPEQLEWASNDRWTKVVLQCDSDEVLYDVEKAAKEAGLDVRLITDSGKTEFNGIPTNTCLCIGPDLKNKIDAITGPQGKFPLKVY